MRRLNGYEVVEVRCLSGVDNLELFSFVNFPLYILVPNVTPGFQHYVAVFVTISVTVSLKTVTVPAVP